MVMHAHAADVTTVKPVETPSVMQVESLDSIQTQQERLKKMLEGKPQAYEDKVMDASTLPPMTDADALPDADSTGFHGYVFETRYGATQSDSGLQLRAASELGHRIEYRRETLNYGDFVAQIDLRSNSGAQGQGLGSLGYATKKSGDRITLRNTGFPITTKIFADTSVGDISSEVTDALSRAYRLSLGSAAVRGMSTRVFDGKFDLRAGVGARGDLAGGPYPGFERSQGTLAWAGYSHRLPGNAFVGLQVNRATGVSDTSFSAPTTGLSNDVTSVATSIGYGDDLATNGSHKARLTYVSSQTSGEITGLNSHAQGFFLEGGFRSNGYRHELGAYSASPNLRFGDYPLTADNRGAYWRIDTSSLRLAWGAGLDVEEQNPGHDTSRPVTSRLGLNANAQYRLNRDDSVGGNLQLGLTRYDNGSNSLFAAGGDGTRSLNASAYYQTRLKANWALSRLRATVRRHEVLVFNDIPATGEEIEWEQDWINGKYETLSPEFVTTLGWARDRSNGLSETQPTAGLSFRLWPDADWHVGGSLRYTSRTSNLATSRGLSGTLDTEKVLPGGWRLGATLSLNRAVVDVSAAAALGVPQVSRSNDKSALVYLRWEGSGGTTLQGAGLRSPGQAGGGSLDGLVYFDANRDGEQQPGENGVPNVEVFLDGRYRVTTDRNGRFDFPLVATGQHQLTLTLETVPLPWGVAPGKGVTVDVPLRGQTTARIPVVRVGE